MNTLLFRKTTDLDLFKGQTVAYCDKSGEYTLSGKIEAITYDNNGIAEYTVCGANYLASELKLIELPESKTYDELNEAVLKYGSFVPVTEDLFYEALEVLPPIWLKNGFFQVDEPKIDDLYHTFGKRNGRYYGCLCNKNFALNNF